MWDKIVVGLQELTLVNRKLGGSQKTEPGVAEEKKKKKVTFGILTTRIVKRLGGVLINDLPRGHKVDLSTR